MLQLGDDHPSEDLVFQKLDVCSPPNELIQRPILFPQTIYPLVNKITIVLFLDLEVNIDAIEFLSLESREDIVRHVPHDSPIPRLIHELIPNLDSGRFVG